MSWPSSEMPFRRVPGCLLPMLLPCVIPWLAICMARGCHGKPKVRFLSRELHYPSCHWTPVRPRLSTQHHDWLGDADVMLCEPLSHRYAAAKKALHTAYVPPADMQQSTALHSITFLQLLDPSPRSLLLLLIRAMYAPDALPDPASLRQGLLPLPVSAQCSWTCQRHQRSRLPASSCQTCILSIA